MTHKKYHNPTEATLERIGGKWKTAILCLLAEQGAMRNGEILRTLSPVTQKCSPSSLKSLKQTGLFSGPYSLKCLQKWYMS